MCHLTAVGLNDLNLVVSLEPVERQANLYNSKIAKRYKLNLQRDNNPTVVPTKSDSDVIFCLQMLIILKLFTPLELTQINRSLVY